MTEASLTRLRSLAGTYAEYALGDVMAQRRTKWCLDEACRIVRDITGHPEGAR